MGLAQQQGEPEDRRQPALETQKIAAETGATERAQGPVGAAAVVRLAKAGTARTG